MARKKFEVLFDLQSAKKQLEGLGGLQREMKMETIRRLERELVDARVAETAQR